MAERRQRRSSGNRLAIAGWLRDRAESHREVGSVAYDELAAKCLRRADEIERGVKAVIVYGFDFPHEARLELGLDGSTPYVLQTDGRLTPCRP